MDTRLKASRAAAPLAALITAALLLAACGGSANGPQSSARAPEAEPSQAVPPPSDGVRRVTIQELRAALEKGEAVVVDVRGGVEYKLGHIAGARSIPLGLIAERAKELPRDKLIVTYCA